MTKPFAGVIVFAILISLTVAAPPKETANAQTVERPNILIFMTDDQRGTADGLSVMDGMRHIFGDEGTYFPNAVATTPLCCPSRASTFTGRFAHNTTVIENSVPPTFDQTTTLQAQLQPLGYKTAIVGKYLNGFTGPPPYFDLHDVFAGYWYDGTYATVHLAQRANEYLNTFEQADDQPWLMYLTPFAPHLDAVPQPGYTQAPVPPWQDTPGNTETDVSDKPPFVQGQVGKNDLEKIKATRDRMIRTLYSVDDAIEQVFTQLDALGESDNTIAFFLSDNGYAWFEHGMEGKGMPYDEVVNVPFFVRWPGHITAGATDPKVVANIDIAPTVYDILDHTPNYTYDGQSLFTSSRTSILTEGAARGYRSLWSPGEVYTEYKDGFREYYSAEDIWQVDNQFVVGTPPDPAHIQALHDELASYFTDVPPPPPPTVEITSFSPTSGAPGTTVTVTGSGFTDATAVRFNGTAAAYTIASDTEITTTVPPGATSGPITVTVPDGSASSTRFTVSTPPPPGPVTSVTVADDLYRPKTANSVQGGTVRWTFTGTRPHSVTDANLLGPDATPLFDSGALTTGTYDYGFAAAGTYPYRSTQGEASAMKGSVNIPLKLSATSGTTTTTFDLTLASAASSGYEFVVQYRFQAAGASTWGSWRLLTATASPSITFTPNQGPGAYQFRSRLRNVVTGRQSGFSAARKVTIT